MGVKKDKYDKRFDKDNDDKRTRWTHHRIATFMEMVAHYVQLMFNYI